MHARHAKGHLPQQVIAFRMRAFQRAHRADEAKPRGTFACAGSGCGIHTRPIGALEEKRCHAKCGGHQRGEETAAPEAPADPVSLVLQTVDATTQMALDAAKAAQAEADKLAAIGTGKVVGSASNAKLAEAAVVTGAAVAKELSKPKKETEGEAQPESKKPEAKKPESKKAEPKAEKKPTTEKPKTADGV